MKVATQVTKIKAAISKGLATQHTVKLVAGLGLGAVLMAGTALHFVPNSNNESGSAFSSDQQRAAERREEAQSIISWRLNHSKPASPSYEEQRAAERHQENLDILEATWRSNEVQRVQEDMQNYHRGVSRPSYEEQRAAERHQENLDILEATRRSNKYYLDLDY
jgi:gas vesicle protein